MSVCDFTAGDLPTDVVGHAVVALVEQAPAAEIAWTSERLLIIRPPEGPIFAPDVLRDVDLTGDLSSVVIELHSLWEAKEGGQ